MKKKALLRGILGFPLGVAIGYAITIIMSLAIGDGSYSPTAPELIYEFGSEIDAVILQATLCGILGASFAASSVIWDMEVWSIVKQTGIYFLLISFVMLPIAYFAHWMERSVVGFILYFAIFIAIFIAMWLIQYAIWKNRIKHIDRKIRARD
jgi:amino acid transporter